MLSTEEQSSGHGGTPVSSMSGKVSSSHSPRQSFSSARRKQLDYPDQSPGAVSQSTVGAQSDPTYYGGHMVSVSIAHMGSAGSFCWPEYDKGSFLDHRQSVLEPMDLQKALLQTTS